LQYLESPRSRPPLSMKRPMQGWKDGGSSMRKGAAAGSKRSASGVNWTLSPGCPTAGLSGKRSRVHCNGAPRIMTIFPTRAFESARIEAKSRLFVTWMRRTGSSDLHCGWSGDGARPRRRTPSICRKSEN